MGGDPDGGPVSSSSSSQIHYVYREMRHRWSTGLGQGLAAAGFATVGLGVVEGAMSSHSSAWPSFPARHALANLVPSFVGGSVSPVTVAEIHGLEPFLLKGRPGLALHSIRAARVGVAMYASLSAVLELLDAMKEGREKYIAALVEGREPPRALDASKALRVCTASGIAAALQSGQVPVAILPLGGMELSRFTVEAIRRACRANGRGLGPHPVYCSVARENMWDSGEWSQLKVRGSTAGTDCLVLEGDVISSFCNKEWLEPVLVPARDSLDIADAIMGFNMMSTVQRQDLKIATVLMGDFLSPSSSVVAQRGGCEVDICICARSALLSAIMTWAEVAHERCSAKEETAASDSVRTAPPSPSTPGPVSQLHGIWYGLGRIGGGLRSGIDFVVNSIPSDYRATGALTWNRASHRISAALSTILPPRRRRPPLLVYDTQSEESFRWLQKHFWKLGWRVVRYNPSEPSGYPSAPVLVHRGSDSETIFAVRGHADSTSAPVCAVVHAQPCVKLTQDCMPPSEDSRVICTAALKEELFQYAQSQLKAGTPPSQVQSKLDFGAIKAAFSAA
jgi:hypothetical protein